MTDTPTPTTSLPIVVHAQYLKDVSFENPDTPANLRPGQMAPHIDLSVNLEVRSIEDAQIKAFYEVTLQLVATAKREEKKVYLANVDYALAVSMPDIPAPQHHPTLLIEVPKLAFPFARQVLAELVQGGGYPALLLAPIDFTTLYMTQFAGPAAKDVAIN
jgi:preprotein translocase subunit SecB